MGLIKTAAEILQGRPRPVDVIGRSAAMGGTGGKGGRLPMHRECTLPDCTARHHSNGYCQRHWHYWFRWGDPYHVFKRKSARSSECCCDTCVAGVTKRRGRV